MDIFPHLYSSECFQSSRNQAPVAFPGEDSGAGCGVHGKHLTGPCPQPSLPYNHARPPAKEVGTNQSMFVASQ